VRGSPHSPRRQRRALYNATTFERRRRMTVLLSRELRTRFRRRSVPVRKGDTVRVLGGSFKGREERVAKIDRRAYSITLDNVTLKTADEKMKPLGLRPGRLVITRLNLSDSWRRRSLRIRDEDVTAEERGEAPAEEEAAVPETTTAAATPSEPEPEVAEAARTSDAEAEDAAEEDDEGAAEPAPEAAPRSRGKRSPKTEEEAEE
jgi:large subunit ribosomal protein L24